MSSKPTIFHAEAAGDAALLTAFIGGGESEAFTALVQRYYGLVQGTARRILQEDEPARDVAQEVFVHFARDAHRVQPGAVGVWLHRAAVRRALNELRSTKRRHYRQLAVVNENHSDHSPEPLPEHWTAALEHLDDAMNRLSDAERQCIIGKFHHGQPLREIAANAGKSEDAARMTIQRTLEKMCSFLRRRGVAVSAAALTTGLSSEMARAGAVLTHEAAAVLSVRVLTAAKSAAAVPAAAILTTALMTKPIALTAAAVLAFTLAAGAGYFANKHGKPVPNTANVTGVPASAAKSPRPVPAPGNDESSGPGSIARPTEVEQVVTRMEDLWRKKNEIIQREPRRGTAPPDSKVLAQILADMEALMKEMRGVTSVLDAASLPEAVAIAQKRNGEITGFLLTALFEHWAGFDSEAARSAAAKLPKELAANLPAAVTRGWAMTDPQTALAAAEKWHAGDRQGRGKFLKDVFEGWNRTDATGSVRAFATLPTDDQLLVLPVFDKLVRQPAQLSAAKPEIAKLDDEVLRGKLVNKVTKKWAEYDGPAAAAWFDSIAWQNPGAGLMAAVEIADGWMGSGLDPAAAVEWAWPKIPEELRTEFVQSIVQRKWAAQDRAAAEAWMNKHGIAPGTTGSKPGNSIR